MLLLVRVGRWEMCIERKPPESEPDEPEPTPVDVPQPMQVYAPDYVGFVPEACR